MPFTDGLRVQLSQTGAIDNSTAKVQQSNIVKHRLLDDIRHIGFAIRSLHITSPQVHYNFLVEMLFVAPRGDLTRVSGKDT